MDTKSEGKIAIERERERAKDKEHKKRGEEGRWRTLLDFTF